MALRDRQRIILHQGQRYYWYAGPFKDVIGAHDFLAMMLSRGELTEAEADAAAITGNSIFLRLSSDCPPGGAPWSSRAALRHWSR